MNSVDPGSSGVKPMTAQELLELIGPATLLNVRRGKKSPVLMRWQKLRPKDMTPKYLASLNHNNNIGVSLGLASEGLCTIDCDNEEHVKEFFALNSWLASTLISRAARGANFWIRIKGAYPKSCKLKTKDGQPWGEWRADGNQTVLQGKHESGKSYRHNSAKPDEKTFNEILWSSDLELPWLPKAAAEEQSTGGHISPELAKRIEAYLAHCPPSIAGSGGDEALFKAACRIANGFDLTEEQTYEALKRWFNPFCKPPWNEERLRYKAAEAQKVEHDKPRGHFLLPEPGYPPMEERPCFHTYFHFWNDGSRLRGPGTYYHTVAKEKGENGSVVTLIDNWICAPLEVLATTATREDNEYGWLVEFTSRNGRQKRCAIPARWFAGRGDEALGELLALGLDITHGKQRALVLEYIATSRPEKRFAAALSTGWHDERTFVLPDEVIGKTAVWYQGKDEQNPYTKAGKFEHWKAQVAARAKDNPNLIVALCGALAGPLFHLFNVSGGGLHWFGHTTLGKTSMLEAAQSAWGGPKFRRTWETTAVGLQAVATLHTDTLLVLDEIHMVDPKVLDSSIYALINGHGKSRGNIHAASRPTARWRVLVLSSGEVSSETQLSLSGLTIRAGQTIRMLDIPVEGKHGAFDSLHGFKGGAEFADALREAAAQHCGHAGPQFVSSLIDARASGDLDLSKRLIETQKAFQPLNEPQRRVARIFSILALAGELATKWGLLPWEQREALKACVKLFKRWQKQTLVSAASSPERKILAAVANFIDRFGDDRFSELLTVGGEHVRDRAGYWLDELLEERDPEKPGQRFTRRIYLFTAIGLKEATKGHDFRQVLNALNAAGAFTRKDSAQFAVSVRTPKGTERLYHIDPAKLE